MENTDRNLLLDEIHDLLEIILKNRPIRSGIWTKGSAYRTGYRDVEYPQMVRKVNLLQKLNGPEPRQEAPQAPEPGFSEGIRIRFDGPAESVAKTQSVVETTPAPPPINLPEPPPTPKPAQKPSNPTRPVVTPTLFPDEPQTIGEKIKKEEAPSVADRISGQIEDKSVASNLMHMPLADIRAAIGINEKFLFINELFGGSLQEYNQAIQSLNQANGEEDALTISRIIRAAITGIHGYRRNKTERAG